MARRDLRQVSFADGLVNQRAGRNSWMDEIDKLIDWSAVVKLLDGIYGSDDGRPSYPLLTYVKLLLLQQCSSKRSRSQVKPSGSSARCSTSSAPASAGATLGQRINARLSS